MCVWLINMERILIKRREATVIFALRITSCCMGYCPGIRSWPRLMDTLSSKCRLLGTRQLLQARSFIHVNFKSVSSATIFRHSLLLSKRAIKPPQEKPCVFPQNTYKWWALRRLDPSLSKVSSHLT